jgi:UDP-N-acetylmuramyl pentapeptide synthase
MTAPAVAPASAGGPAPWRLAEVARATGAEVARHGGVTVFSGVATDSRTLAAGELFVALRGARYDAHAFVAEALARGAAGVVVERLDAVPADAEVAVLVAADALRALQDLAAARRRAGRLAVLAITGSNGKTTTRRCWRRSSPPRAARPPS